jgi:hypothetical protein
VLWCLIRHFFQCKPIEACHTFNVTWLCSEHSMSVTFEVWTVLLPLYFAPQFLTDFPAHRCDYHSTSIMKIIFSLVYSVCMHAHIHRHVYTPTLSCCLFICSNKLTPVMFPALCYFSLSWAIITQCYTLELAHVSHSTHVFMTLLLFLKVKISVSYALTISFQV